MRNADPIKLKHCEYLIVHRPEIQTIGLNFDVFGNGDLFRRAEYFERDFEQNTN